METDAQIIDGLICRFRMVLDLCDSAADSPIQRSTIHECRDACRRAALVAERLDHSQDDGK